ncbi:MAG TPA: transcription antitermination factor NusB [Aestuariivirgaceae bacterium]|nr:transcription antitermination factor NusB [Aestuariivirgaceae bacterium]
MGRGARAQASPADPSALEARRQAVWLLGQVLRHHRAFDDSFAEITSGSSRLPDRERAFVRALAATALRRLGQIEHLLARFLAKPLPAKSGHAREILIVAAAQILFMRVPAHAAIDVAVEIARSDRDARHFAGLINAVLRRLSEVGLDAETDRATLHLNTPAWLWRRWCDHYGEDAAGQIAARHAEDPPLDITVKSDPKGWAEALGGDVLPTGTVRIAAARGRIEDLPGYGAGDWWVQDAAAALPARLLGDVAGSRVLDLCAAPGGKTAQLAAAGARVTALDHSEGRLERLKENLARLHLTADIVVADAARFQSPEAYDAMLLDAPCTATGIVRRNPDIPHLKSEADLARLPPLQAGMLDNALGLVRPGGLVVYCTCSLEPEEGVGQITSLLERIPGVSRVPIAPAEIGGAGQLITPAGDLRTLPSHGLDGFFAARLRRA